MIDRLRGRQNSRNSWSAVLAALLGVLAGVSAFGLNASFAGGPSIEHGADARIAGKPASVRPDTFDPSLNLGGLADAGAALGSRGLETDLWPGSLQSALPADFELPVDIARTRDGRSRAPPRA